MMTKFRYDINALRALAVSAVVLYHYKADFILGGFVGVDIFFVISGYLMTNIIVGRLQKGSFNIFDFYYDRAKRIVPGLLGLCIALIFIGYLFMDPMMYNYLAYTSVSAIFFFSNIRFAEDIGYFDPQSAVKWLLHTWSLSVEWQFYLIYPVIIFSLYKFSLTRRYLAPILWLLAVYSLFLCISYSTTEPTVAFYLLPQRAWELLAGGIVALQFNPSKIRYLGRPFLSRALLTLGFLLIIVSIYFFNYNLPWPYYWALGPVLGTCLVIAANQSEAILFKCRFVQLIGKWSYSIYLWHWPIAVTALYFNIIKTTALKICIEILILAAILATGGLLLSWWRSRVGPRLDLKSALWRWAPIAGMLLVTLGLAVTVTLNAGFANRRPDSAKQLEIYRMVEADWDFPESCKGRGPEGELRPCRLGQGDGRGTLVIGNSFSMQAYNRFAKLPAERFEGPVTFLASPGCPPVPGIKMVIDKFHCNGFFDQALHFAEAGDFKRIAFISAWYGYFGPEHKSLCFLEGEACVLNSDPSWYYSHVNSVLATLRAHLLELRKRGVEIAFVSATPIGKWDIPPELLKRQFLRLDTMELEYIDRDEIEKPILPLKSRLIALASSLEAKFIEPLDFLCDEHRCPTIADDGVPYFRDQGHYRAGAVREPQFRFYDDALGLTALSDATSAPQANNR